MNTAEIPTTIVVASGKGGVGKTRISVDLARALAATGVGVGFLDADISTPNAPQALAGEGADFSDQRLSDGEHLVPVDAGGIYLFSQGLHLDDDVAILRDDEWKGNAVLNYIYSVDWPDDTEYLVVDSPPGNGSELQLVISEVQPDHGFLITTGATHSVRDTRRTHELFTDAGVPHSVIANMRRAVFDVDVAEIEEQVQEVEGVGPSKAETIRGMVEDLLTEVSMPLHDEEVDIAGRVGEEVVADVPFTTNDEIRVAALEEALDVLPQPAVVD